MGRTRRRRAVLASVALAAAVLTGTSGIGHAATARHVSWLTVGFNLQHTGANRGETELSPSTVPELTQKWAASIPPPGTNWLFIDSSPVFAADVSVNGTPTDLLFAGDENGDLAAVDAQTGSVVWRRTLGWELGGSANPDCSNSPFGITDSPVIDRSTGRLYVVDGDNMLYALRLATGKTVPGWPISMSPPDTTAYDHVWSGLDEFDGNLYVSVGSKCDDGPYRGRVAVVSTTSAAITSTFYVNGADGATGGAIWGWGGVSIDPAHQFLFTATGNALGTDPDAGYSDSIIKLELGTLQVSAANDPGITGADNDFGSTPVLFQRKGCPPEAAVENKNGKLYLYDRGRIHEGPLQSVQLSPASSESLIGDVAWSAADRRLYVSTAIGTKHHPAGVLAYRLRATSGTCLLRLAWQAPVGPASNPYAMPAAPPTVADHVVYYGDGPGNTITALDAASGDVLWSATLPDHIETAPIVANGMLYVPDWDGQIYAFGLPAG